MITQTCSFSQHNGLFSWQIPPILGEEDIDPNIIVSVASRVLWTTHIVKISEWLLKLVHFYHILGYNVFSWHIHVHVHVPPILGEEDIDPDIIVSVASWVLSTTQLVQICEWLLKLDAFNHMMGYFLGRYLQFWVKKTSIPTSSSAWLLSDASKTGLNYYETYSHHSKYSILKNGSRNI